MNVEFFNIVNLIAKETSLEKEIKGLPVGLITEFSKKSKKKLTPQRNFSDCQCVLFSAQMDNPYFWQHIQSNSEEQYSSKNFSKELQERIEKLTIAFMMTVYFSDMEVNERFTKLGTTPRMYEQIMKLNVLEVQTVFKSLPNLLTARNTETSYWDDIEKILEITSNDRLIDAHKSQNIVFMAQEKTYLKRKNCF